MEERRSYFRINDCIGLSYSTLDGEAEFKPDTVGDVAMPVTDLLAEIDSKFSQAVNILWQENPIVAQALGALNKKISIIAAHSLQANDHTMESYEELMVSISGCGLAFDCSEQLPPGTRLSLSVVLKPSNVQLKLTAKVVTCESQSAKTTRPYWMRLSFDGKNSAAREHLIQHIVQKQYAQLGDETPNTDQ